jgi:ribosome biogenesis protein Nip4
MGEERNVYKVLMVKPEGKRPLERPRHRWEDGIRMDLREIGWGSVDWIHLAQYRDRWWAVVNMVMNL